MNDSSHVRTSSTGDDAVSLITSPTVLGPNIWVLVNDETATAEVVIALADCRNAEVDEQGNIRFTTTKAGLGWLADLLSTGAEGE